MEENKNTEFEEYITFKITTSTGEEMELAVIDEFEFENKNYDVAAKITGDTIDEEGLYLYEVKEARDDFNVEKIRNQFTYEKVAKAYMEMNEE